MGATLSYETRRRSSKLGTRMYPYEPAYAMQLNQPKFSTEDEWIKYMKMNVDAQTPPAYDYSLMILKPPQAFYNTKPISYYHEVLTILPLCQRLESFPNSCNALCVKRFMERHGISDVIEPMQHLLHNLQGLSNNYFGLP